MNQIVINFDQRMMFVEPGTEPAVAFLFLFQSTSTRLIKFTRNVSKQLLDAVRLKAKSLELKDDRQAIITNRQNANYVKQHPEILKHPLSVFNELPPLQFPTSVSVGKGDQYVSSIVLTYAKDYFNFKIKFFDESVLRMSMHSSLIWIFIDVVEMACREMEVG